MFNKLVVLVFCLFLTNIAVANKSAVNQSKIDQIEDIQKVNINLLSAQELASKLNGIGLKKAQSIVDYRTNYGDFIVIEQLMEVKGIGQSLFEKNKELITVK